MELNKIVKILYVVITIYIFMVISATSLTFFYILPAILLMWLTYMAFSAGYKVNKSRSGYSSDNHEMHPSIQKNIKWSTIAFFSMLFSVTAVYYYTGQMPLSVWRNLSDGVSLYSEYQIHFIEQQRYEFSAGKIPFILMLFYVKLALIYSYAMLAISKNRITKSQILSLLGITLSYLYVGVARGTYFEFFELGMLVIFTVLARRKLAFLGSVKAIFKISILVSFLIVGFFVGIGLRGYSFSYNISSDVFFDPTGILSIVSPGLSFLSIALFGYFGFGFFYIATYVNEVWFSSTGNLIAGFLPFGHYAIFSNTLHSTLVNIIDMGVRWSPDISLMINYFGFVGTLVFCFLLGFIAKQTVRNNSGVLGFMVCFLILMQMFSLPIGNFVIASSANILTVTLCIAIWIWRGMKRVKIKL